MPIFNQFHYAPLKTSNSIRLIILDAASNGQAPLSCPLIQVLPGRAANYHAISYVWGERKVLSPSSPQIRHDDDTSYLRITPNIDTVLRRFRSFAEPQYLWLDAIYLDKDDKIEKAQQIPQIRDIYQQAESMHI
ncbi:heterokaryon incompatibility protein-domain-containing protein [Lasiosphaeria hispida]|uniref:Heterokaryon incompatibility protein-domain-containing protein n=1 Tax=Lasiosphaeria hispida TaxID=260671 RepID=A0AAJ0HP74_9PEZI|nr:heterokaryon incompatibility protein-domain-containing protein [Lasiosphaeria hispida]